MLSASVVRATMTLKILLQSSRLPFLILTPICVSLGLSTVVASGASIDGLLLFLILLAALSAHISVNALNEYQDYKSGLDLVTTRTPFSGGSGALPQHPAMVNAVLLLAVLSLLLTVVVGLFLVSQRGVEILPLGILGVVLIIAYTDWINRHPLICLIAPGVGFGLLMVAGSQFVLQGFYAPLSWWVALVPFFMVNNLLLLNQYPDIRADAGVGRKHFPITYGVQASNRVYALFLLSAIAVVVLGIGAGYLSRLSLIALLPVPLALYALFGAIQHGQEIGQMSRYLAANVLATLLMPLLLALSLLG
jgi:1,4-dihydroxy-2-naphthoate octaprenyltransferase